MKIRQDIDFKKISEETGVKRGKISWSTTFKSWVVIGHPDIDMICIDAPYKVGDSIGERIVESVEIDNKEWVFTCNRPY